MFNPFGLFGGRDLRFASLAVALPLALDRLLTSRLCAFTEGSLSAFAFRLVLLPKSLSLLCSLNAGFWAFLSATFSTYLLFIAALFSAISAFFASAFSASA